MSEILSRRAALAAAGGMVLAGCDKLSQNSTVQKILGGAEQLNLTGQRIVLTTSQPLADSFVSKVPERSIVPSGRYMA